MVKNEMLASWVYSNGELVKQRFMEKTGVVSLITGLLLFIGIMYPLILWDTIVFNKITGLLILLAFFIIVSIVYYLLQFFSGILFSGFKKLIQIKEEEVIITTLKIITEKKTWILSDEQHLLTSVECNGKLKAAAIIFKGKEINKGQAGVSFTVRLPVPAAEKLNGEKICHYFKESIAAATTTV
jgi:hypothetical protein